MAMRIMQLLQISVTHHSVTKPGSLFMGRKPIGKTAMTAAERQRRRRARLQKERPLADLRAAWDACDKKGRTRFLRELPAASLQRKQERRAALERALAEKIVSTWPEADRRLYWEKRGYPLLSGG
jgi:hypothetical protein